MTEQDAVMELIDQGRRPREIAAELGVDIANVRSLKAKARKTGDPYRRRFNAALREARENIAEAIDISVSAGATSSTARCLVAAAECLTAAKLRDEAGVGERVKKARNG